MKISVFTKTNDERSIKLAREFIKVLPPNVKNSLFTSSKEFAEVFPNELIADIFVCFGGDGTILRCALAAAKIGAKLFAVNTGNLGFLSSLEGSALPSEICAAVLSDKTIYEKKYFLEGFVEKNEINSCVNKQDKRFFAFNEIAVARSLTDGFKNRSLKVNLKINDNFVDEYLADGLIIATPIGSTAYSLSAGGAILDPELKGLIATAVCPHSLRYRPIVFNDEAVAKIGIGEKRGAEKAGVYADGNLVASLLINEYVVIKKSNLCINIAKGESFFTKLNKKLKYMGIGE